MESSKSSNSQTHKTLPDNIDPLISTAMEALGGSGTSRDVCDRLAQIMAKESLSEHDTHRVNSHLAHHFDTKEGSDPLLYVSSSKNSRKKNIPKRSGGNDKSNEDNSNKENEKSDSTSNKLDDENSFSSLEEAIDFKKQEKEHWIQKSMTKLNELKLHGIHSSLKFDLTQEHSDSMEIQKKKFIQNTGSAIFPAASEAFGVKKPSVELEQFSTLVESHTELPPIVTTEKDKIPVEKTEEDVEWPIVNKNLSGATFSLKNMGNSESQFFGQLRERQRSNKSLIMSSNSLKPLNESNGSNSSSGSNINNNTHNESDSKAKKRTLDESDHSQHTKKKSNVNGDNQQPAETSA